MVTKRNLSPISEKGMGFCFSGERLIRKGGLDDHSEVYYSS